MINLIQPLPFFDRLSEQERFKESSDGLYRFLSPPDTLIPFQIAVPSDAVAIEAMKIRGFMYEFELDFPANSDQVKFQTNGGRKWVMYKGDQLTFVRENGTEEPLVIPAGYYWFEITVDGKTYYSEVFCVPGDGICDEEINMIIEAWNDEDSQSNNGRTFWDGFKYKCYFHSFITNVVPDITDEFTKDGYERQILLRRVMIFNYNIELDPLPNTVSIGLAYLTSLSHIVIKHNGNEYNVKDITFKPDSVEGGSLDTVQLTFSIFDQDVIKTNC